MTAVRRSAPTDRRAPVPVVSGRCPVGASCYCCPSVKQHNPHARKPCSQQHPAADRTCSPPYPANIPPCPEREFLPLNPPPGTAPLHHEVCDDCGRITARRWTRPDGYVLAWCAGEFPTHENGDPR